MMKVGCFDYMVRRISLPACFAIITLVLNVWTAQLAAAQDAPLTPKLLEKQLAANPTGADAERLAGQARLMFGRNLTNGAMKKQDGLTLAFGIETAGVTVSRGLSVTFSDGHPDLPLQRIGETAVYAGVVTMPNLAAGHWKLMFGREATTEGDYELYAVDPASVPNPDTPHGKLTQQAKFRSSIFPQTERDWWIYVPAQYKSDQPACVMIIQDGAGYIGFVPTVVDNLIASGEMPVTVCVFINPGTLLPDGTPQGNNQRSYEYDTVSDQYSKFLLEDILPEVEKTVKLRHDAASRCIAGLSSGASCAFTAAWFHPDQFSKVLSWIGSYTDLAAGKTGIEGAHNYPFMIRRSEKKPIRVYLQDGDHDLDNQFGNWPLANQSMAAALKFKGYDYQFVFGHGGHSGAMGTAYLPAALRWLWKDYKLQ
jgi:enterochelin esterase family protein